MKNLENEVSKSLPAKEIEDLDLDIVISYDNEQLDVDVDVGVLFDELSAVILTVIGIDKAAHSDNDLGNKGCRFPLLRRASSI